MMMWLAKLIIGKIQKMLYKDAPINSFEPFHAPVQAEKADGSWYVSEIRYGEEYPNSFLDITYPNRDTSAKRPTVVYFHGGGFFGGDKAMGDPMAADNDATRLFREIVANGFNFVNVNYALVPDCHFPVPLIQTVQALDFLKAHAAEYGLDMENVVIFGQSAGAILTGQYGALLASEEYRRVLNLHPMLTGKEIKALIIDDAPFFVKRFGFKLKLMTGYYIGTMKLDDEIDAKTNAIRYLTADFAPSFLTAGNTDGFPEDMQAFSDRLNELGVENEYFFTPKEIAPLPHGYLNLVDADPHARECFDHILTFMKNHTDGGEKHERS